MSKVQDRFSKLLLKLEFSASEIVDARRKFEEICQYLHDNHYFLNYDESTRVLIGSHAKNTAIPPPSDVDVLFIMPQDEYYRYDEKPENGQLELLQGIKTILTNKYHYTVINEEDSSVMVNFVDFNVRIKPAFMRASGIYLLPQNKDGGSWSSISPQAEKANLFNSNTRSKGNTLRLIRMLKAWKNNSNVQINSFTLELSSIEFMEEWNYYDQGLDYCDWMIRDYFEKLLSLVDADIKIPGIDETLNCSDAWREHALSAYDNSKEACEQEKEKNHVSATREWVKIFGGRFPIQSN